MPEIPSAEPAPQPHRVKPYKGLRAGVMVVAATVGMGAGAAHGADISGQPEALGGHGLNALTTRPGIDTRPSAEIRGFVNRSRLVLARRAAGAEDFVPYDFVCNVHRVDLGDDDGNPESREIDLTGAGHCIEETDQVLGFARTRTASPTDYAINNTRYEYIVAHDPEYGPLRPIGLVRNIVVPPVNKRDDTARDLVYLHAVKAPGIKGNPFESVTALRVPSKEELYDRDMRVGHRVAMSAYTTKSGYNIAASGKYLGTIRVNWDFNGTPDYSQDDISQDVDVVGFSGPLNINNDPAFYSGSGQVSVNASGEISGSLSTRYNVQDANTVNLARFPEEEPSNAEDRKKIVAMRKNIARSLGGVRLSKYPTVALFQTPQPRSTYAWLKAARGKHPKV